MRQAISIVASLLVTATLVGCDLVGLGDGETVVYEVAGQKASCTGLFQTLCLQVREPGEEDFYHLHGTPAGFEYQWGFEYVIEVEETPIEEPPADGSSIRRSLERIVSRTPVEAGSSFVLSPPTAALTPLDSAQYSLFHEPAAIRCTTAEQCAELEATRMGVVRVFLRLAHPELPGDPLVLLGLEPCTQEFGPCP